jgi:hypothetical protein
MAEVLGAVAAAAQLTAICVALIELTNGIKRRSSTLRNHQDQLAQLNQLSVNISSNPLLQTEDIELHTRNIISLLSQHTLHSSIKKSRASQVLLFFTQERTIARLFGDLERHKTTLSLIINEIQSGALHEIRSNLVIMPHQGNHTKTLEPSFLSSPPSLDEDKQMVLADRKTAEESPGSSEASGPSSCLEDSTSEENLKAEIEYWADFQKRQFPKRGTTAGTWAACKADGNVLQINGLLVEGDASLEPTKPEDAVDDPEVYMGCTAKRGANQVNGSEILYSMGGVPTIIQPPRGQYFGCSISADKSEDKGPRSRQTNGLYIGPYTRPA